MSDDLCQRCNHVGEDRRTLWMAAMYDLSETGLPLRHVRVTGKYAEQTGEEVLTGALKLRVPVFTEEADAKDDEHRFYTMRVCKDCRAEWMLAIRYWFQEKGNFALKSEAEDRVEPGMHEFGGGVPVRVFGATVTVPKKTPCPSCKGRAPNGCNLCNSGGLG